MGDWASSYVVLNRTGEVYGEYGGFHGDYVEELLCCVWILMGTSDRLGGCESIKVATIEKISVVATEGQRPVKRK